MSADAQTMPATTRSTTRRSGDFRMLTVSPMAVPVPALKYPLRVAFADQIEGNAAPLYLQAFALIAEDAKAREASEVEDGDFPAWVAKNGAGFDTTMPALLDTATLRGECDWAIPIRFENVRTLVPFLNQARQATNVLRAKFHLALLRDDVDQAIRLLRTCSVLGDRLDDGDTFIVNNLVSVGVQAMCMEMTADLIQRVDAPDLYWSLRAYPTPFGNLQRSLDVERAAILNAMPTLRKPRDGAAITADDWRALVDEMDRYQNALTATTRPTTKAKLDLAAGLAAMAVNGPAKAYYARTRHLDIAQVAKLDPLLLAAVFMLETYQRTSDDFYKWFALPYSQLLPGVANAGRDIAADSTVAHTIFAIVAPSLGRVGITNARLDRTIAAITVVESLRAYAAAHDGTLPPTLEAIVDTPAPMNPVTGKPFDYAVNGDVATISDDGKLVDWPLRYEVRLRH